MTPRCPHCSVALAPAADWLALHAARRYALTTAHERSCTVRTSARTQKSHRTTPAAAYTGGWERVGLIWRPILPGPTEEAA